MNTPQGATGDVVPWVSFIPTFSSDIGNAAASFTGGSVNVSAGRFKKNGHQGLVSILFNALTLAVTPAYIKMSLPIGWVPQSSGTVTPASILIAGTWETGQVMEDATGFLKFYRANQVVFPAGTTFSCSVKLELELQ